MSSETQWPGPPSASLGALPVAGFSITYEEVPQAIVNLEHAASFFRQRAQDVAQTGTWASDVSDSNPAAILEAGAKQLEDLARKLGEDLKAYLQVEELSLPRHPTAVLPI